MNSHQTPVRKRLLLGAALLTLHTTLLAPCCRAQSDSTYKAEQLNQLSFNMRMLTHGEACGGGLPKDDDKNTVADKSRFLYSRVRLNVDYERKGLQAHATIQNKSVWGNQNNQALNLYEGWVKLSTNSGLFTKIGRVALSYDDERIIGANDFATAALSHDVLIVGYEGHGHQVHAILGYNQNGANVYKSTYYDTNKGSQYYKSMQTLWYHYDVPKVPLGVSLLFMNVGLQAGYKQGNKKYDNEPEHTVDQRFYGGYFNFHPDFLTLEGSYYKQQGKQVFVDDQDGYYGSMKMDAWMASIKATVKAARNYGFEISYDYLSGDDYVPVLYGGMMGLPRHETLKGFAPLYGSRTKFYGIMDYFYESAYSNGFTPGLQKASIGAYVNPTPRLNCQATYHYLATATELNDLNRTLGHAVELQASYQFSDDISLIAGYTQMTGTETMSRLKDVEGGKQARWGWFSLVISPSLFKIKW